METKIKEDLINVLNLAVKALRERKHQDLSEISNHIIHDVSIFQDSDSLSLAVMIYALSKIVQRCCEQKISYSEVILLLDKSKNSLEQNNLGLYNSLIKKIFEFINKIDNKIKLYVQEVLDKAKIKKGSKVYEHGLSAGRSAEMMGITQWELLSYIGKTNVSDYESPIGVKQRLKTARELFA